MNPSLSTRLVNLRQILSIMRRPIGLVGLSSASRAMARALRKIKPKESIHIVGPPDAGKTTLFRYLRHEPQLDEVARPLLRPRAGRMVSDLAGTKTSFFLSLAPDDVAGEERALRARLISKYNPDGIIFIIDTHNPEEEHAYLQELYDIYRDFSTQSKQLKLKVLLILLNKFDLWGNTAASRDALMNRYRHEILHDLINRFRSSFGVTVQFGYASLTQTEHAPYNNVILRDFLVALKERG
jgi:GTPase involved in cell partitioning and DNA repair